MCVAKLEKRGGEVALENVRKVIIAVREAKLPESPGAGKCRKFLYESDCSTQAV